MGSGASTSVEAYALRVSDHQADLDNLGNTVGELRRRIDAHLEEQAVVPQFAPAGEKAQTEDLSRKLESTFTNVSTDHLIQLLKECKVEDLQAEVGLTASTDSVESKGMSKSSPNSGASSSSSDSSHPPGPLVGGDYVWQPKSPFKLFNSKYGSIVGDVYEDVHQLTLSHFLGSGAEGTVYRASYTNNAGETLVCAVKIAGAFPDENPDTHAAIELLAKKGTNEFYGTYEREKNAHLMLRPREEDQWQFLANGKTRLLQLLGFNDIAEAVILEYIDGEHPQDMQVMESVHSFLKLAEKATKVEVGDVKLENLIRNGTGDVTIIDFGCCQYLGGATCKICNKFIESDIDAHTSEHVQKYYSMQKKQGCTGPVSRLRLQEFCYGESFC